MGSGQEQGQLWGPGARDWADYNEPMCTPFYEAVLNATGVGSGTRLLDVGCGAGLPCCSRRGGAPPYPAWTRRPQCWTWRASASPPPAHYW